MRPRCVRARTPEGAAGIRLRDGIKHEARSRSGVPTPRRPLRHPPHHASVYRPLATLSNNGFLRRAPAAKHQLIECSDTGWPSRSSTASRTSRPHIGRWATASTLTTARCTTPLPSRPDAGSTADSRSSLAPGPTTADASNTAARAAEGFENCPTKCISAGLNVANRTTRGRARGAASVDSLRSWPTTSEGAPSSAAPDACSASRGSCRR